MGVIVRIGLPSLSLQLLYGSETNCSSPNIHLTRGPCSNLTRSACYSAPGEHHLRRQAADRSILRRRGHGPEEDPAITTRNSQQTPRKSESSPGSALTPRFHDVCSLPKATQKDKKILPYRIIKAGPPLSHGTCPFFLLPHPSQAPNGDAWVEAEGKQQL